MYKAPFYAITKALYKALMHQQSGIGLEWFDSSVPINEIEDYFKNQSEFAFGMFGQSTADCTSSDSLKVWTSNLEIEVYSNYKGRKIIVQKIESLINWISSNETGWKVLCEALNTEGFALGALTIGSMNVNTPLYSDVGVWQSGNINIIFKLTQLESGE